MLVNFYRQSEQTRCFHEKFWCFWTSLEEVDPCVTHLGGCLVDNSFSPTEGKKQMCKWETCATGLSQCPSELPQTEPYLSFLESSVDIFILLVLLQLGLHKHLTDVHDLLHCQSQTFHRVTELLLEAKTPYYFKDKWLLPEFNLDNQPPG